MKLLDIRPEYINEELARKICRNPELKREYIRKYNLEGGSNLGMTVDTYGRMVKREENKSPSTSVELMGNTYSHPTSVELGENTDFQFKTCEYSIDGTSHESTSIFSDNSKVATMSRGARDITLEASKKIDTPDVKKTYIFILKIKNIVTRSDIEPRSNMYKIVVTINDNEEFKKEIGIFFEKDVEYNVFFTYSINMADKQTTVTYGYRDTENENVDALMEGQYRFKGTGDFFTNPFILRVDFQPKYGNLNKITFEKDIKFSLEEHERKTKITYFE